MKKLYSDSAEETEKIGQKFAKNLKAGNCIAFEGDLGAGKTAFVRGLALGLNLKDDVCSPTYAIVNEYLGDINLYHFDMYRINSLEDLYSIGFFDYLDSNAILAIEWSENIKQVLPKNCIYITINKLSENKREILINGGNDVENISIWNFGKTF